MRRSVPVDDAAMWATMRRAALTAESILMGSSQDAPPGGELRVDAPGSWCLRCGRTLRSSAPVDAASCDACRIDPGPDDAPWPLVRAGAYRTSLRCCILRLKRAPDEAVIELLADSMARQWQSTCAALRAADRLQPPSPAELAVQPIPMPLLRRLERGHDHGILLARAIARRLGAARLAAIRQEFGVPQALKGGVERRASPGNERFRPRRRRSGSVARRPWVLLVDDVRTTGTTLLQAARVLRGLGCRHVAALVAAVSHDDLAVRGGSAPSKGL